MNWRLALLALASGAVCFAASLPQPDIRFEGNESFSAHQLLGILRNRYHVALDGNFGVTEADDAAYFLRTFYFSQGFRSAAVDYDYRASQPPSVLFQIDEGVRKMIGTVRFEGESALPRERLHDIFTATVREMTLRPFGRLRYVERAVEAGRAAIVSALEHEGYLLARATIEDEPLPDGTLVNLVIRIDQGTRYFVRDVSFSPEIYSKEELRGVMKDYLDQPYRRNQETLMQSRLADWLRNRGYLEASVASTSSFDPASGEVSIAFTIDAGQRYKVGTIAVDNDGGTRPREILSRFGVRSGEIYDASDVDEGARRLWFSGAFSEAEVERIPQADGTVDLVLHMKEAPAKRLQFGVGYSQWDRAYAEAQYVDRNFFNTLNRYSIEGFVSQRSYGISSTLADPWLFGSDFEGSITGFFARRELPAYRSIEYGGTLSLLRRYSDANLTGYRLQYGWKRVTDSVIYGDDASDPDPNYTLGSVTFGQTYDTRNNILSPMKGLYARYETEVASEVLGGELSFVRLDGQFTYYLPLRPITTERPFVPFIVFNHRAGVLFPFADTSVVPVQERFFLGGPNTVRSFQLDGLGPKDSGGDPVGGLAMMLVNLEVQWPVFNNIYLAAFADAGNLWAEVEDIQPVDLQVGVGPGLRVYTPLGAVRVDYGYNIDRQPGDPIGAWQIGFGFTF